MDEIWPIQDRLHFSPLLSVQDDCSRTQFRDRGRDLAAVLPLLIVAG